MTEAIPLSQQYLALASCPDALTDEIDKETRILSVTPNDRRQAYLDLKILRRDIMLLALGVQELAEEKHIMRQALLQGETACKAAELVMGAIVDLAKRVEVLENEKKAAA